MIEEATTTDEEKTDVEAPADDAAEETSSVPSKWEQNRSPILLVVFGLLVAFVLMNLHLVAMFPNYQALNAITNRDLDTARWWLDVAQQISPYNSESQFLLARIHRREGDVEAAEESLALAEDLGCNADKLQRARKMLDIQRGNLGEDQSEFTETLTAAPWDMHDIYESYIVGSMTKHEYGFARRLIEEWITHCSEHERDNAVPYYYKGRFLATFGEWPYAEDEFRRAVEKDPTLYKAHLSLGDVLSKTKYYDEAIESYAVAMSGLPIVADAARVGQASCLRAKGQLDDARKLVELVLADRPDMKEASIELGHLELADKNYDKACDLIGPHVSETSRDYDLLDAYAGALKSAGKKEEAEKFAKRADDGKSGLERIESLSRLLAENPNDFQRRVELASNHLDYGTAVVGVQGLEVILAENPDHQPALEKLAEYYEAHRDEAAGYGALAIEYRDRLSRAKTRAEEAKKKAEQAANDKSTPDTDATSEDTDDKEVSKETEEEEKKNAADSP